MSDICSFAPTNTLASANFDILKIDGVEDPLVDVNKLATLDFEESYFYDAIKFITECNNEITNHKMNLYTSISETTSTVVVLESFSDFFVKVKEIITKFLKFIKSLFAKFITALHRLVSSDKYLEKHKKDFKDFKSTDEFKFDGFNYTFSDSIPIADAQLTWGNNLFKDIYGNDDHSLTHGSIEEAINAFDLEADCAEFRGKVIGKVDEKIYLTDFSDELFKIYRNGESTTEEITADRIYITRVVDRFFHYNKLKQKVDSKYKEIEDAYTRLQKQVQDIVKRNGDLNSKAFIARLPADNGIVSLDGENISNTGHVMSGEIMVKLDSYVKIKIDQIQEYSNIHTLAFAAKLDAMKECANQDRNTLYTALSRIQRTDNRRKED